MDQQKIIHLVGETVIVGGLFIYFHRQLKHLHEEIDEMKETIIKQQEFIEKNFAGMSKAIDFLMAKQHIRASKPKFNVVPIDDNEESQVNELLFPNLAERSAPQNAIFIQSIARTREPPVEQTNIEVVDEVDPLEDTDDILEELNQVSEPPTETVTTVEEVIKTQNEQISEEKKKSKKTNLKTKK
jgi:hypothetical protein